MRQPNALAALAAIAVVLLAAGCGGGGRLSRTDYEHRVNAAGQNLSMVFGQLQNVPGLPHQQAVRIERARESLDRVTDGLADVKPPEKAEDAHRRLVAGLRAISTDLKQLAAASESGNEKAIQKARAKLASAEAGKKVISAIQELQREGFDVNRG